MAREIVDTLILSSAFDVMAVDSVPALEPLELDGGTAGVDGGGSKVAGGRVDPIAAADRAFVMDGIALCASRQGDYEEMRARAMTAAAIWGALGDRPMLAHALATVGLPAWLSGEPPEALESCARAM